MANYIKLYCMPKLPIKDTYVHMYLRIQIRKTNIILSSLTATCHVLKHSDAHNEFLNRLKTMDDVNNYFGFVSN